MAKSQKEPTQTMLTLNLQLTIEHSTDEEYEKKRDKLIQKLEEQGFTVDIASEDSEAEGEGWPDEE